MADHDPQVECAATAHIAGDCPSCSPCGHAGHRVHCGARGLVFVAQADLDRALAERDEARAEGARLRAVLDAAEAFLRAPLHDEQCERLDTLLAPGSGPVGEACECRARRYDGLRAAVEQARAALAPTGDVPHHVDYAPSYTPSGRSPYCRECSAVRQDYVWPCALAPTGDGEADRSDLDRIHLRHGRQCSCLDDSATCCRPSCACHTRGGSDGD